MKVDVVADVGNTRIKWGRCLDGQVADVLALAADDPRAWAEPLRSWNLGAGSRWAIASVVPRRSDQLARWLEKQGARVRRVDDPRTLPLRTRVLNPQGVGMDRLLNAVAVNRRRRQHAPAVIVDAGSAVTVDLVDRDGVFAGGAIFPGHRLMAQALHEHTALLPLIEVCGSTAPPGSDTQAAMKAGIYWTVAGGIEKLIRQYQHSVQHDLDVFLTGGDAALFSRDIGRADAVLWPDMTLEGLRLAAEALP
jgi:type III pantothenate kinase